MQMKLLFIILFISSLSFSQDNWQKMMFSREANFYDILGRKLIAENNINVNTYEINSIKKSNSILLLKIILNNNHIEYRKIMF